MFSLQLLLSLVCSCFDVSPFLCPCVNRWCSFPCEFYPIAAVPTHIVCKRKEWLGFDFNCFHIDSIAPMPTPLPQTPKSANQTEASARSGGTPSPDKCRNTCSHYQFSVVLLFDYVLIFCPRLYFCLFYFIKCCITSNSKRFWKILCNLQTCKSVIESNYQFAHIFTI